MSVIHVEIPDSVLLLKKIQPNHTEILAVFWEETFTAEKLSRFFELVNKDTPSHDQTLELFIEHFLRMDFGMYQLENFDAL